MAEFSGFGRIRMGFFPILANTLKNRKTEPKKPEITRAFQSAILTWV